MKCDDVLGVLPTNQPNGTHSGHGLDSNMCSDMIKKQDEDRKLATS